MSHDRGGAGDAVDVTHLTYQLNTIWHRQVHKTHSMPHQHGLCGFTARPYLDQAAQVSALSGCLGSEGEVETIRRKLTGRYTLCTKYSCTQIEVCNTAEIYSRGKATDFRGLKADTFVYSPGPDGVHAFQG